MQEELDTILSDARARLSRASTLEELAALKVEFFGRNSRLTSLLRSIPTLAVEERKTAGAAANRAREEIESLAETKESSLKTLIVDGETDLEPIDLTLPGYSFPAGGIHPITRTLERLVEIFTSLGYAVEQGPQIEDEFHNFDALNIPATHPARDMHDTFFVGDGHVLRTHTSPVQIRTMERVKPPVRIIAPGKVYRADSDATHSPMFHQIEGLCVDTDVTFADLKGTLKLMLSAFFEREVTLRFRPSYFPFTEPSAECDIGCVICGGKGCRVCKGTGFLEVLGAGMVHPKVFEAVGYDPSKYIGFAFGVGVERLAMLSYGIDDIKLFYRNDLRFLRQF